MSLLCFIFPSCFLPFALFVGQITFLAGSCAVCNFTHIWMYIIPSLRNLIQDNSCSVAVWSQTMPTLVIHFVFECLRFMLQSDCNTIHWIWRPNTWTLCPKLILWFNVQVLFHFFYASVMCQNATGFLGHIEGTYLKLRSSGSFGHRLNLKVSGIHD